MRKNELIRQLAEAEARISTLENIICPAFRHDYVLITERISPIDAYGTVVTYRSYACKRCQKLITKEDYIV